jgi:hypothetical protein
MVWGTCICTESRWLRRRGHPAADSFKDSHSDFWAAADDHAVSPRLTDTRLDPTHSEAAVLKRQQHADDTAMPAA